MTSSASVQAGNRAIPQLDTVISAESYVSEPADLWRENLPAAWRDKGPRIESGPFGDQFAILGAEPRPLGLAAPLTQLGRIGVSLRPVGEPYRYTENLTPGGFDATARVAWQQRVGLSAELLYPRLGLFVTTTPDAQLQQLACRVYNDWIGDYCWTEAARLKGLALLPAAAPIEAIVAEIEHAASLGLAGVILPVRHAISSYNMPEWDAVWDALQSAGLCCVVHLGAEEGAAPQPQGPGAAGILVSTGRYDVNEFLQMIVWGGAVTRFPGLRFGLVGSGVGWLATQLTLMDHWWHDHKGWMQPRLGQEPSHFWRRQGFASFHDDGPGVATREIIGVENLLWGVGMPTETATSDPVDAAARALAGVPDGEAAAIAAGNASRLLGIDRALN